MINPANETFGQARQGSVAAIIQVLNERLADIGIRTRAVVAEGMLQLLCEAATPEQLEKTAVVDRVRNELETISPQRIKKVKINSRIVKEEQLLWLEEINRDPDNALLWAEVITLKRPFFLKRWIRDRNLKPAGPIFKDITEPEPSQTTLSTKAIGAGSLALLLLGAGWLFRDDISRIQPVANTAVELPASNAGGSQGDLPAIPNQITPTQPATGGDRTADITPQTPPSAAETITQAPVAAVKPNTAPTPPANSEASSEANSTATQPTSPTAPSAQANNPATNSGAVADAFAEAVRVAEQAAVDGQTATTAAAWLDLAARWQRASDLMGEIPDSSEQYAIAQDRISTYKENSESALTKASNVE